MDNLDWMSPNFPDFVAKTRASICVELQSILLTVRQHTQAIGSIAKSWGKASGVEIFTTQEGRNTKLTELEQRHRLVYNTCDDL